MANYQPPTEDLPIFDPTMFQRNDTPLTIAEGYNYFLAFPIAQGAEEIGDLTVGNSGVCPTMTLVPPDNSLHMANTTWVIQYITGAITGFAPINSPAFTGIPTVPTPAPSDNSLQIPNTSWVRTYASSTYQTLSGMSLYALLASPIFSGTPTVPSPVPLDNSLQIPNTSWVNQYITGVVSGFAPINSPVFTGDPQVPLPAPSNNSATIPSTSWVRTYASSTYQTLADMVNYLTIVSAAATYLTIANASTTYLTIANAAATYQTIAGMSSYLTISVATATYQTLAGMVNYALLASPTFTGIPISPLPTPANNNTSQIATCAWVNTAISASGGGDAYLAGGTSYAVPQTFTGFDAFTHNITSGGVSVGMGATSNNSNSVLGDNALNTTTTSVANCVAIGTYALPIEVGGVGVGIGSTAVGTLALQNQNGANYNTALGYGAGYNITSGSYNTCIGNSTAVLNPTGSNQIVIGTIAETTTVAGLMNFTNFTPSTSIVPTLTTSITNKAYVDSVVSGANILPLNNTFTGTNQFNNTVSFNNPNSTTTALSTIVQNDKTLVITNTGTGGTTFTILTLMVGVPISFQITGATPPPPNPNIVPLIATGGTGSGFTGTISVSWTFNGLFWAAFALSPAVLTGGVYTVLPSISVDTSYYSSYGGNFIIVSNQPLIIASTSTATPPDIIINSGSSGVVNLNSVATFGTGVDFIPIPTCPTAILGTSNTTIATTAFVAAATAASSLVPVGSIIIWAGNTTAPSGFLFCNGLIISTTTYATLFAVIGYTYGGSGGVFNLPNMFSGTGKGTVPVCSSTTSNTGVILSPAVSPVMSGGNQAITTAQLASHSHNITYPSGSNYAQGVNFANNTTTGGASSRATGTNNSTLPSPTDIEGSGEDYLPPFVAFTFIIKT